MILLLNQGNIYINGIPLEEIRDWFNANSGYVLQYGEAYYKELTVRENITLAAQLKLPNTMSQRQKLERVEQILHIVSRTIQNITTLRS